MASAGGEVSFCSAGRGVFVDPSDHLSPTVRFENPAEAHSYVSTWARQIPIGFGQAADILRRDAVYREFLAPDRVSEIVDLAVSDLLHSHPDPVSTASRI